MTSFKEACHEFLHHLSCVKGASEHTVRSYATDLNQLHEYLAKMVNEKNIPLSVLSPTLLRGFVLEMSRKDSGVRTLVRRLSTFRSFCKFCCSKDLLLENPAENIENPKLTKYIPHILNSDQVEALFSLPDLSSYLGLRDRAMLELFYSSGLRVSELASLNKNDLNPSELLLKVMGKGKKERVIPFTKGSAYWLEEYLNSQERHEKVDGHLPEKDKEAIFLNKLGTRISTRSIDRLFAAYIKQLGLAGRATPHTLRHTIATHLLEKGMSLKMIQSFLGHSTPATTTIYTQVSPTLKKKVYDKAHPRA